MEESEQQVERAGKLLCTVISVERVSKQLQPSWWLFFRALLTSPGADRKQEYRTKERKDSDYGETFSFELDGSNQSLCVQLVAWGALHNLEVSSVELTLESVRAMCGEQSVQVVHWFSLLGKARELVARVRLAFELCPSDASLLAAMEAAVLSLRRKSSLLATNLTIPSRTFFKRSDTETSNSNSNINNNNASSSSSSSSSLLAPPVATRARSSEDLAADVADSSDTPQDSYGSYTKFYGASAIDYHEYVSFEQKQDSASSSDASPVLQSASAASANAAAEAAGIIPAPAHNRGAARQVLVSALNAEWQTALNNQTDTKESTQTLADLSLNFQALAQTYGRLIIREQALPFEQKQIKPLNLGGIIGGDKFLIGGILFKLARDRGIFNSDEAAAKVAGHELKGLTALFNANRVHKLGFALPLVAIIDHLGFRAIALALLPVSPETLILGSRDGGVSIVSKVPPDVDARLRKMAEALNVRVHRVRGVDIPLAIDCELHMGTDGRFYLLDLSRVMPPEAPDKKHVGGHLYRLLRPEFVRSGRALCSDSCSPFLAREAEREIYHNHVVSATKRLVALTVQLVALSLDQLHGGRSETWGKVFSLSHMMRVLHVVHSLGCNVRFLGRIYSRAKSPITKMMLMIELVSRVAKRQVRELCRAHVRDPSHTVSFDQALAKSVVGYFNLLFTRNVSAPCMQLWSEIAKDLCNYFGKLDLHEFTGPELFAEVNDMQIGPVLLFQRLSIQLGFTWSPRINALVDASVMWLSDTNHCGLGIGSSFVGTSNATATAAVAAAAAASAAASASAGSASPSTPPPSAPVSTGGSGRRGHKRSESRTEAAGSAPNTAAGPSSLSASSSTGMLLSTSPRMSDKSSTESRTSASFVSAASSGSRKGHRRAESFGGNKEAARMHVSASSVLQTPGSAPSPVLSPRRGNSMDVAYREPALSGLELPHAQGKNMCPWTQWARSDTLFFQNELVIGDRIKMNNTTAACFGKTLMHLSESAENDALREHFRLLAIDAFSTALNLNPTDSETLTNQAWLLFKQEAYSVGITSVWETGCMMSHWWSSVFRYIDFLFRIALAADATSWKTLYFYGRFLRSGDQSSLRCCWLLTQALLYCENEKAMDDIRAALIDSLLHNRLEKIAERVFDYMAAKKVHLGNSGQHDIRE